MPTIKIPNGSGGWIKFPTIKGDKGDKGDPGNTPTWNDVIGKPSTFPPSTHSHDDKYYTESEIDIKLTSKAESSTVSGHTGNSTVHVTSTDKSNWNAKAEVGQIPTKLSQLQNDIPKPITIGSTKPTDGSMWYQEI